MIRKKRKKNKAGRKCKLTKDLQDQITLLIRAGNYTETSAAFCGISKDTFYDWLKKGAKNPNSKFGRFSDAVGKAIAESEVRDVQKLAKAPEWQTVAWRLERRFPTRWGRMDRQEISGPGGGPVQTNATVTAIPFQPEHVKSAYKDHLRRQIEAEDQQKRIEQNPPEPPEPAT